jgi:L-asparaginase
VLVSKIIIAGTGGTIAGRASNPADNVGYQAGALGVADLLKALPASPLSDDNVSVEVVNVAQVDSKDMGPVVWAKLLRQLSLWLDDPLVRAVVVTHGTDTIEETAWLLSALLPGNKPVVLTCAMRPASALVPDGPQNLLDALAVACDPKTQGVCVVAAGWVHGAQQVQKVHPYRLDPFSSGEAGPLACIEEGRVRWFGKNEQLADLPPEFNKQLALEFIALSGKEWPRVELVFSHAGATAEGVDTLCAPREGVASVRGLVVAGTGNGTVHQNLEPALRRAQAAGVVVWRCSRCAGGYVVLAAAQAQAVPYALEGDTHTGTPSAGRNPTHWPAVALSPVKARLALVVYLMTQSA